MELKMKKHINTLLILLTIPGSTFAMSGYFNIYDANLDQLLNHNSVIHKELDNLEKSTNNATATLKRVRDTSYKQVKIFLKNDAALMNAQNDLLSLNIDCAFIMSRQHQFACNSAYMNLTSKISQLRLSLQTNYYFKRQFESDYRSISFDVRQLETMIEDKNEQIRDLENTINHYDPLNDAETNRLNNFKSSKKIEELHILLKDISKKYEINAKELNKIGNKIEESDEKYVMDINPYEIE